MSASVKDGRNWLSIAATPANFALKGGTYMLLAHATWGGGNIEVQALGPDGSTWLSFATPMKLTADGTIIQQMPAGTYRLNVTTAIAIFAALAGIDT